MNFGLACRAARRVRTTALTNDLSFGRAISPAFSKTDSRNVAQSRPAPLNARDRGNGLPIQVRAMRSTRTWASISCDRMVAPRSACPSLNGFPRNQQPLRIDISTCVESRCPRGQPWVMGATISSRVILAPRLPVSCRLAHRCPLSMRHRIVPTDRLFLTSFRRLNARLQQLAMRTTRQRSAPICETSALRTSLNGLRASRFP
jgi:hypothetical protein